MKRLFVILAVALSLGGCAALDPGGKSIFAGGKSLVATFANPVAPTNIYQVKIVYAAAQDLVMQYQRDCFGSDVRPYPVTVRIIKADPLLSAQCAHRVSRYNAMKDAENKAYNAIVAADEFISRNPSGNVATYIAAAWKAVTDYRAKVGI